MFNFSKKKQSTNPSQKYNGFGYLDNNVYYFDSACQTLRPQEVIDAEQDYYHNYNACGHRVKYKWGEMVDKEVQECRKNLLKLVGKSSKDYTVAFCLNATAGINLVLHQLPNRFDRVVTSEIEHSSVFLPSLTWAKNNNKPRLVLERDLDYSLKYSKSDLEKAIVMVNTHNNFDGGRLENIALLAEDVVRGNGLLLIDACQTMGHDPEFLRDIDFDACFGSGHKMYGPSIGFIIIKKSLVKNMDTYFIGGSTISNNLLDSYELIEDEADIFARLEPGLQNFAGIVGLNEAIKWRNNWVSQDGLSATEYEKSLAKYLHTRFAEVPNINLISDSVSAVVSLYSDKIDAHKLALYLGQRDIMCRSGYHCVYYYLIHKKNYPPLFRISLGLNNTKEQIDFLIESLQIVLA